MRLGKRDKPRLLQGLDGKIRQACEMAQDIVQTVRRILKVNAFYNA
jgi:hypothetical protein